MPFEKGNRANPGGRPKAAFKIREAALKYSDAALAQLVRILEDDGAEHKDKIAAAKTVLEYGIGKPSVVVDEHRQAEIETLKAKLTMLQAGADPDAKKVEIVFRDYLKPDAAGD